MTWIWGAKLLPSHKWVFMESNHTWQLKFDPKKVYYSSTKINQVKHPNFNIFGMSFLMQHIIVRGVNFTLILIFFVTHTFLYFEIVIFKNRIFSLSVDPCVKHVNLSYLHYLEKWAAHLKLLLMLIWKQIVQHLIKTAVLI